MVAPPRVREPPSGESWNTPSVAYRKSGRDDDVVDAEAERYLYKRPEAEARPVVVPTMADNISRQANNGTFNGITGKSSVAPKAPDLVADFPSLAPAGPKSSGPYKKVVVPQRGGPVAAGSVAFLGKVVKGASRGIGSRDRFAEKPKARSSVALPADSSTGYYRSNVLPEDDPEMQQFLYSGSSSGTTAGLFDDLTTQASKLRVQALPKDDDFPAMRPSSAPKAVPSRKGMVAYVKEEEDAFPIQESKKGKKGKKQQKQQAAEAAGKKALTEVHTPQNPTSWTGPAPTQIKAAPTVPAPAPQVTLSSDDFPSMGGGKQKGKQVVKKAVTVPANDVNRGRQSVNGQTSVNGWIGGNEYMPEVAKDKAELVARNQGMMRDMKALLQGDEAKFNAFKSVSGRLQKGDVQGREYHATFTTLFGRNAEAQRLFKELVVLLPAKAKQEMLMPFCK